MTAKKKDNFFAPIGNTKAYLKAAFQGFAGTGKTHTAAIIAIGLHRQIGSKKPIVIFDTERAAKFLKPLFDAAGIEVLIRESRSLADLAETQKRCREGLSDVLIIDSITHVWNGYLEAFKAKKNRDIQFQDWGQIKPTWAREFADPYVTDPIHIIMCGRAGFEYSNDINEVTGKREIYKSGVKMRVEGETNYEPDLLVLMNRVEYLDGNTISKVVRTANIIKDRSTIIDGDVYENPTYEDFKPMIDVILSDPVKHDTTPSAETGDLFKEDERNHNYGNEKKAILEEISGFLAIKFPSTMKGATSERLKMLKKVFDTTAKTAMEGKPLKDLRHGYGVMLDIVNAEEAEKEADQIP